jgi:hypothetical protein
MSTKPIEPEPFATPEVVVENLRAAVYASHAELAAQVQADSALDSKLVGPSSLPRASCSRSTTDWIMDACCCWPVRDSVRSYA